MPKRPRVYLGEFAVPKSERTARGTGDRVRAAVECGGFRKMQRRSEGYIRQGALQNSGMRSGLRLVGVAQRPRHYL
jgi:hypothetical protein